jgi:hypothetical protein
MSCRWKSYISSDYLMITQESFCTARSCSMVTAKSVPVRSSPINHTHTPKWNANRHIAGAHHGNALYRLQLAHPGLSAVSLSLSHSLYSLLSCVVLVSENTKTLLITKKTTPPHLGRGHRTWAFYKNKKKRPVAFSPQANYTHREATACCRS